MGIWDGRWKVEAFLSLGVSWEYVITNIKLQVVALEWKVAHTPRCLPARQDILGSCLSVCLSVSRPPSATVHSVIRLHASPLHFYSVRPFAALHQLPSWAKTAIQAISNFRCSCRRATSSRHKLHRALDKSPRNCHPLILFDPGPSRPVSLLYIKLKKQTCRAKNFYHSAGLLPIFCIQSFSIYPPTSRQIAVGAGSLVTSLTPCPTPFP